MYKRATIRQREREQPLTGARSLQISSFARQRKGSSFEMASFNGKWKLTNVTNAEAYYTAISKLISRFVFQFLFLFLLMITTFNALYSMQSCLQHVMK